jgi:hypothetical protein
VKESGGVGDVVIIIRLVLVEKSVVVVVVVVSPIRKLVTVVTADGRKVVSVSEIEAEEEDSGVKMPVVILSEGSVDIVVVSKIEKNVNVVVVVGGFVFVSFGGSICSGGVCT